MRKVRLPGIKGEVLAIRLERTRIAALGTLWPDGSRTLVPADVAIHWIRFGKRGFFCKAPSKFAEMTGIDVAVVNIAQNEHGLFELRTPNTLPINALLSLPECDDSWDAHPFETF